MSNHRLFGIIALITIDIAIQPGERSPHLGQAVSTCSDRILLQVYLDCVIQVDELTRLT